MTKLYEVDKCNHCPFFVRTLGCTRVDFPKPRQVPIKIEQWEDENGKHDRRYYPIPEWCPLPGKEV